MSEQLYLKALSDTLEHGYWLPDRTNTGRTTYPGVFMKFDLREAFTAAVTTKKLFINAVVGELGGFMNAFQSAADFRALGCNVWDPNANEDAGWLANKYRRGTDDVGVVYGAQWREWNAFRVFLLTDQSDSYLTDDEICETYLGTKVDVVRHQVDMMVGLDALDQRAFQLVTDWGGTVVGSQVLVSPEDPAAEAGLMVIGLKLVDQIHDCIDQILRNPTSRRILFHGWNPATLDKVALPACHVMYQFYPNPDKKELSMQITLRSNDAFLGAPFNMASAGILLSLIARLTGYTPGDLSYSGGDFHIYDNHIDQVQLQLTREPLPPPKLWISDKFHKVETAKEAVFLLTKLTPEDIRLEDYQHQGVIKGGIAVVRTDGGEKQPA